MVPVSYSYRNLLVRWKTTVMTALGFTLVVAALTIMLAFVRGVEVVCVQSGQPENVLVLNKGISDEVLSRLPVTGVSQIENSPGVARNAQGRPLASRELFMVVQQEVGAAHGLQMLQVRGILPAAYQVHTQVQLVDGRAFVPGNSELIIGQAMHREYGIQIGDRIPLGRKEWVVTGVFESSGAGFEAETWCDLTELASLFRREGSCSTVVLRADDPAAAEVLAYSLSESRSNNVEALTEPAYYAKQAQQANLLVRAAWVIAWFMGIGAVFGVMNTMFAAIGQRTKDIAVMRILGFKPHEILMSFLLEAVLISILGGGIGIALGFATNGLSRTVTLAAREIAFAFHVDSGIMLWAAAFSISMGVFGGLLPALSAMRIRPLEALR